MHEKPKLSMMKRITECEVRSSCAFLKSKTEMRMMLKLRGGTAAFQIEMGRWHGLKREELVCKECDSGEVEDVCHWLLQCSAWNSLRQPLLEAWTMKGKMMETELALSYHILVLTITFYLSLPPCGQLGSSNHTALFILSYTKDLSHTLLL